MLTEPAAAFTPQPAPPPSPGELINELAASTPPAVAAVVPPFKALMPDAVGRAGVSAVAAQQAVSGAVSIPDGSLQSEPDTLAAAARLAHNPADLLGQARIAASIEMYASNVTNAGAVDPSGANTAAQLDFGKVQHLVESGKVVGELASLWKRFVTSPQAVSDGEVSGLLDMIGQVGNATEAFDKEGLDSDAVSVAAVDMLADGPAVALTLTDDKLAGRVLQSVGTRLPDVSAGDELEVHVLPDGSSAVITAPASSSQTLRNLYPAIGKLWAPAKARVVPSLDRLAANLESVVGVVHESWPAGSWDEQGGHPALAGESVVTAVLPEGQVPRAFRKLGDVRFPSGAGVLTRPAPPDPDVPDDDESFVPSQESIRSRRVVIALADSDPAVAAAEVELLGGQDVVVYAPGQPPDGWMAARESVFRDPSGSMTVVRSAPSAATASSPHTVDAWVRPSELPIDVPGTERSPKLSAVTEIANGMYQFGDVVVTAPGLRFEKADLLSATAASGAPLVGIGMTTAGGVPALTPVFEGQSEEGFEAYAKIDGRNLVVKADPLDLTPTVELGLVLGLAGVNPSRITLEGASMRSLLPA